MGRLKARPPKPLWRKQAPQRIEIDHHALQAIVERAGRGPLANDDIQTLTAAVETLGFITQALEHKSTSLERLRRMLFGPSTEKTKDVLATLPDGTGSPSDAAGAGGAGASGETAGDTTAVTTPEETSAGHGRNGASAYTGAQRIPVAHESLKHGDPCPECQRGKVYRQAEPAMLVRVTGQAPLVATVWECERLRCNACGEVFTARPPPEVGTAKYDARAAGMIALLKYGCGMPFNRLERLERGVGIPLPAATQWEIVKATAEVLAPAYVELIRQAAQGTVLHNDDTTIKILELMAQARVTVDAAVEADGQDGDSASGRTGMFTSGIIATSEGRKIALFFSGRSHAGENLAAVLAQRAAELGPPIQMCDALSRNMVDGDDDLDTVVANCLAHGRRKFVEVATRFPQQCRFVLESLREVYATDAQARQQQLSPEARLSLHQQRSGPVMAALETWSHEQLDGHLVEPNSGLGDAISYLIKHWPELTLFLRVAGAPLDNNVCERALKKAILHRKNALFFKTLNGAHVGDLFMSLIHTAEIMRVDAFDYLVALQQHGDQLAAHASDWMPWSYRATVSRLTNPIR